MFHAGLAHNCDYKSLVKAFDDVDHWNSYMSPGKKKRSGGSLLSIRQRRQENVRPENVLPENVRPENDRTGNVRPWQIPNSLFDQEKFTKMPIMREDLLKATPPWQQDA